MISEFTHKEFCSDSVSMKTLVAQVLLTVREGILFSVNPLLVNVQLGNARINGIVARLEQSN